jgi:cation diffusion facilitator family transporter
VSGEQTASNCTTADREKRRVALSSLAAAFLLTTLKLIVGLATNSLGILAEAVHSALDLVAAGITYWAVRISGQPADREHTYGHGKFENLSALVQTLLLLGTCVWIVYEAGSRLFVGHHGPVIASAPAFAVILLSIAVDYSRSKALKKTADKYNSQALEADALHFSTDIWSSCVVLLGLSAVFISNRFNLPWLEMADALAALGVAVLVIWVSLRLGKKSVADLLDSIPPELHEQVTAVAAGVPGVEEVRKLRLRRSGPEVFADLTLSVNHATPFERTHQIADAAESAVREVIPGADVIVHVEPVTRDDEGLLETVRVLAARHGLGAHGIRIYEEHDRRSIELHLEVSESLNLEQAHAQATGFESELRRKAAYLDRIVSHIEPSGDDSATRHATPVGQVQIEKTISEFLAANPNAPTIHDISVQRTDDELAVSFHCTLDPATKITDAHVLTERIESHLRKRISNLGRVVIHVEPPEGK